MRTRVNKRKRMLYRWTGYGVLFLAVTTAVVAITRREEGQPVDAARSKVEGLTRVLEREIAGSGIRFEDVSRDAGLTFRHFPGTRASLLPEDMGSGMAVGDFDGDGFEDVYLVNFARSLAEEDGAPAGCNALYRNRGDGTFEDVTDAVGVELCAFGMGAAWGDYDNDGDLDLYVTNYGPNVLFRNDGDRFVDVTHGAAVSGADDFSAGCAWGDFDRDGHVDLYVCTYVEFKKEHISGHSSETGHGAEMPYTLNPSTYEPVANRLYRNNGDGTFTDVAMRAGVADPGGRSLGVVWMDMDLDGWPDLYVANDVSYNGVFHNQGDGRFADIGAASCAADYRGAMGLGVDDMDHDGDLDLFITHWLAQENALFENMWHSSSKDGKGKSSATLLAFFDRADRLGVGQSSLDMVGWSTGFVDFDNDGWNDLWVVNGSTLQKIDQPRELVPQPMLFYWHVPGEGYYPLSGDIGEATARPFVGRGGVQADFDRDGRWDLLLMCFGETPLLLRNTSVTNHHWIEFRLRQDGGNTQALGALVEITAGGQTRMAQVGSGTSYLSQHSEVVHYGLGPCDQVERLRIRWPDGAESVHENLAADKRYEFTHASAYGPGK